MHRPGPIAYLLPLVALAIGVPILAFATIRSVTWVGRTFPGFFVMQNAVVPTVSGIDWPPDRAGIFHARVTAVDGERVRSGAEVYERVAAHPPGTPIEYTLAGEDGEDGARTVRVAAHRFGWYAYLETWGILLAFAWSYLAIGLVVAFLQPRTRQARVYLLQALVGSIYPAAAVLYHQASSDHPWLTAVGLAAECVFPATYVHLALVFPVERRLPAPAWLWTATPYVLSAVLVVLGLRGFYADPPTLAAFRAAYVYTSASILFFVAAMVVGYVRSRDPAIRGRILAVLPGVVFGTAAVFLIFLNNASAGRDLPIQFGLVPSFAFYVSVAYAIAKHDLFDVDRVVRQSFVYGLLTVIVLAGYALALSVPAQVAPAGVVGALFVLGLAFLLDPLRRGVQRVVDRAFFRSRLDGARTVAELSEALTSVLDLDEIVARVTQVVTEAMQLESTTLAVAEEGRAWSRGADGALRIVPAPPADLAAAARAAVTESPIDPPLGADAPAFGAGVRAVLGSFDAAAVLPLVLGERPLGFLALGAKRSGRPLGARDVRLLRTLANQAAIAIQNALSFRALGALNRELDEKVRARTEEVRRSNVDLKTAYRELQDTQAQLVHSEKMASLGQLVAGVAHELNNPASFVHGSLGNLSRYLATFVEVIQRYRAAPIADPAVRESLEALSAASQLDYLLQATPELLRYCAEGSERIKRIVEDLRVFVRAEQGERSSTDLAADLEATLRLLAERIANVRIERRYGVVAPIEAHAGQLNQVWMNLLANAVDAVEGHRDGVITVAISDEGAWVKVVIADNGVGIPSAVRGKIFDPFFTTKAIGRGTGLGLSIAYGAVRSHGGHIAVESEPGRGTTMTVRLPRHQARPHAA
ncbi:MAG: GAF domain-containing protein [Deltaproteobacteria bacterium]|nr:GAF domain-containing protein [Deltaproteobacteria bacterium]